VLGDGAFGRLVQPERLGDALVELLRDSAERERLAEVGRARACDFDWNEVATAYERVYDDVLHR
jgi:glycosyltransferase involved in cell wall biosynthesis